jgi:hypothetical protein
MPRLLLLAYPGCKGPCLRSLCPFQCLHRCGLTVPPARVSSTAGILSRLSHRRLPRFRASPVRTKPVSAPRPTSSAATACELVGTDLAYETVEQKPTEDSHLTDALYEPYGLQSVGIEAARPHRPQSPFRWAMLRGPDGLHAGRACRSGRRRPAVGPLPQRTADPQGVRERSAPASTGVAIAGRCSTVLRTQRVPLSSVRPGTVHSF